MSTANRSPSTPTSPSSLAGWAIAAAVAVVVGTLGPWISLPLGVTVSGLSIGGVSDPRIMVVGAVIVAFLAADYRRRGHVHNTDVLIVVGAIGVYGALHDIRGIDARPLASAGWGVELDLLAFAAIALIGVILLVGRVLSSATTPVWRWRPGGSSVMAIAAVIAIAVVAANHFDSPGRPTPVTSLSSQQLYRRLLTTAVPDAQLPDGFSDAQIGIGDTSTATDSANIEALSAADIRALNATRAVTVTLLGPDLQDTLTYYVTSRRGAATAIYDTQLAMLETRAGKVPGVRGLRSEVGAYASLDGDHAAAVVLDGDVVIDAEGIGMIGSPGSVSAAAALARFGIAHLRSL